MRGVVITIFALFVLGCLAQTPQEFIVKKAIIFDDPLVAGSLLVDFAYDACMPTTANDSPKVNRGGCGSTKGVTYVKYYSNTNNPVMEEVTDYFFRFRFQNCITCDATTYKAPMPVLFKTTTKGTDGFYTRAIADIVVNGVTCKGYENAKAASASDSYRAWFDENSTPVRICRHQWFSGKKIDFLTANQVAGDLDFKTPGSNSIEDHTYMNYINNDYRPTASWGSKCTTPQCRVKLDIMVVQDDSGSIDNNEFVQEIDFIAGFFNAFTIGPDDIVGGVTSFSGSSFVSVPMNVNNNKNALVNSIKAMTHYGGSTCIGCGISLAQQQLAANGRNTAPDVMMVITDGYNNVQTNTFPTVVANAQAVPIEIFGVGVGSFLESTLDSFVSNPKADHKFLVNDFNSLSTVLNSVITATCPEIPGTLCGAGCAGLCACSNICYCPSTCDDFNLCTSETCVDGQNNNGCVYSSVDCNPTLDLCNTYTCDAKTGCIATAVDCDDQDPCTVDTCVASQGCKHSAVDCDDGNVCTKDTCNSQATVADPCVHTDVKDACAKCQIAFGPPQQPVDCSLKRFNPNFDKVDGCNPYVCNPNSANNRYDLDDNNIDNNDDGPCEARPLDCDDGNPCTTVECDTVSGTCVYQSFKTCDDGNACTNDRCDPTDTTGDPCRNEAINPVIECADGNPCTVESCNPNATIANRCVYTPLDCSSMNECLETACEPSMGGCVAYNRTCVASDACHLPVCTPLNQGNPYDAATFNSTYCSEVEIEGTINQCGECLGNDASCFLEGSKIAVGFIAAGVLAAIIVGVIIAVALGVFGSTAGYMYMKNKGNNNMAQAKTSPIYDGLPSGSNAAAS